MGLDAGTLMTALVVVCAVLCGLLVLTWMQNRGVPALGIWTLCFALFAAAAVIVGARDRLPGLLALDIANGFRMLAFGLAWQAARYFTNQKGNWPLALAPTMLWLAAWALVFSDGDVRQRILVAAPLVAAYTFAIAGELWRAAPERRWGITRLAAIVAALHGAVLVGRFFAALLVSESSLEAEIGIAAPLNPLSILETLVAAVALAFLLLSVTREAIGLRDREAALLDPLTGVCNRRGFVDEVGRMLARAGRTGSWTALIAIDLDRFKAVNDGWGHLAGDRLLQALAAATESVVRPGDVVGRLGGDEFAVALADSRIDQALVLAERIRRAVAAMRIENEGEEIRFTVSVGVASMRETPTLDPLFGEADAALYRAKARGGNRVEFSVDRRAANERDVPAESEQVSRIGEKPRRVA